jgi:hypothetical protein
VLSLSGSSLSTTRQAGQVATGAVKMTSTGPGKTGKAAISAVKGSAPLQPITNTIHTRDTKATTTKTATAQHANIKKLRPADIMDDELAAMLGNEFFELTTQ